MEILIVNPRIPAPETNSGELRFWEIITILLSEGHQLSFFARVAENPDRLQALRQMGVECVLDTGGVSSEPGRFAAFLSSRHFDCAIFATYTSFNRYAHVVRSVCKDCILIVDTVDLHHVRLRREAELLGGRARQREARRVRRLEWDAIRNADCVWVVTEDERTTLGMAPPRCYVIPNVHRLAPDPPAFGVRAGLVFLGGYQHPPNVDAIHYFINEVRPHVITRLHNLRFTIAGSHPPEEILAYQRLPNVTVTGSIPDHRAVLLAQRVGIAPLRYGAGMKGKIGEYLACGLPCVSTSIGVEGMGLSDGVNVLQADDPAMFAEQIVRLHEDAALWQALSKAGQDHIRRTFAPEALRPRVREAVAGAADAHREAGRLGRRVRRLVVAVRRWVRKAAAEGLDRLREAGGRNSAR